MSKQEVRISNWPTTAFSTFTFIFIVCLIMSLSGCDSCNNTNGATQCTGKVLGEIYKDLKTGFEVGSK